MIERRTIQVAELRAADDADNLRGYAAVFNEITDIGGWFKERVIPGAFAESIGKDDIRALFNHDPNFVLGRNIAGTLQLAEDTRGLLADITVPDAVWAKDLCTSIRRGDVSQMSFAFDTLDATWDTVDGEEVRTLKRLKLYDASIVTYPAYEGTSIGLRAQVNELEVRMSRAEFRLAQGRVLTAEDIELLRSVGRIDGRSVDFARRRLALLERSHGLTAPSD